MLDLQFEELEILHSNLRALLEEVALSFDTPDLTATVEWLQNNFVLPDVGSLYDFYNTPYFLGVALAIDDPEVREIVLMKAAQIGWTYFLLGYLLKRIAEARLDPCSVMMLFAKSGDGKNFHDEKLVPSVLASAVARASLDVSTSRQSGNRWDNKSYEGGFLKIVGSNSPGNVKSSSKISVGVVEEPDDTSDNVAGQGDAIALLEERLKRAINSLLIVGGTPAIKGLSKTEKRLRKTDQRVLLVECHNCGERHVLDWSNVHCDQDENEDAQPHPVYGRWLPDTAIYRCPDCGWEWSDFQRKENIRKTCFDAYNAYMAGETESKLCGWEPTAEFSGAAGFQDLSELYVCMEGTSLADVYRSYLEAEALAAKGDQTAMRAFLNQKLGKAYEYKGDHATADQLRELCQDYQEMVVPRDGLILTAGIDVQRNPARVAVIIRAWGRNGKSWCVYWGELSARNSTVDPKDGVWEDLEALLFRDFRSEAGYPLNISAVSIDSSDGFTSDAVYDWVRRQNKKRSRCLVMAIKGSSDKSRKDPEIFTTPRVRSVDHKNPEKATKADRRGVKIYQVGTNKAKDWIAGQLKLLTEGVKRFFFYTGIRDDYFDQILGAVKAPDKHGRLVWQDKNEAHEVLDCEVYALHAARALRVHLKTPEQWDALENDLSQVDLFGVPDEPVPAQESETNDEQSGDDWLGGYGDEDEWV